MTTRHLSGLRLAKTLTPLCGVVIFGLYCTPKTKDNSKHVVAPETTGSDSAPQASPKTSSVNPEEKAKKPTQVASTSSDSSNKIVNTKTEASPPGEGSPPAKTAPPPVTKNTTPKATSESQTASISSAEAAAEPAEAAVAATPVAPNSDDYATCKTPEQPPEAFSRKETYRGAPFQPGELSEFEMSYMGVLAGSGTITVDRPTKKNNNWHRVFKGEAKTGDWYKYIFILKDKIETWSRPWDFGVAKFYMEQDEGKLFSSRYIRKKWIDFDHAGCKTTEKEQRKGRAEKNGAFELQRGAVDTLGATFYLRHLDYKIGQKQNVMIYSSEKNWLLEANPVAIETVETKAGTFSATKLKLQTYIGQDLQQKGDVYIWIANDRPERPMVQVKAEIKIGSIWIKLKKYQAGRPL